jgi:hypothetical protein
MRTCGKCRKRFDAESAACPYCGAPNAKASGLFQTSTVLISSGGANLVYGSVDEVPAPLRNKLLKSTNGQNSATILIADRRGREVVARAVHDLPGSAQQRLRRSWLGIPPAFALPRLAAARRAALQAAMALAATAALVAAYLHYWR